MNNNSSIHINIDPDIAKLIPEYLENRQRDIRAIEEALGRQDYSAIQELGHSLKGSGGGYGFDLITEIGAALERSAKSQDSISIQEHLQRLIDYLKRLVLHYE